jgi:hypothetical protein
MRLYDAWLKHTVSASIIDSKNQNRYENVFPPFRAGIITNACSAQAFPAIYFECPAFYLYFKHVSGRCTNFSTGKLLYFQRPGHAGSAFAK